MKKIKMVILVMVLLILCACTSVRSNLIINKDKSLYFEIYKANSKDVITDEITALDNYIKELNECGYVISNETVNGIDVLKASINIDNIDDLLGKHNFGTCDISLFNFKKEKYFIFDTYEFNINVDKEIYKDFIEQDYALSDKGVYYFKLITPYKTISNNANDDTDGYYWDLDNINEGINFKFYLINSINIIGIIIGLLIIIILLVVIVKSIKNKKIKKNKLLNEVSINME